MRADGPSHRRQSSIEPLVERTASEKIDTSDDTAPWSRSQVAERFERPVTQQFGDNAEENTPFAGRFVNRPSGHTAVPNPENTSRRIQQEKQPPRFTVLQIGENQDNAAVVERLVDSRSDLRLANASNGYRGFELARSLKPDVILMDINLPDINGLTALKILCETPETSHIPIVALSSNDHPRQIFKEGLDVGFFLHLIGPYKQDVLMDAIDLALIYATNHRPSA
jgi:CheY-like chemotaxis protein